MAYEKNKKPRFKAAKPVKYDGWVGLLQDCILAVVKLEKAETVRLAPLVKEAGIDDKADRSAFVKKNKKDKASAAEADFADSETDDEVAGEPATKDGRATQREKFEAFFDEKTAARVAFYNANKDPLLIAFGAATTKAFTKWYDARSGTKVFASIDNIIAQVLSPAVEALEGLAAAHPDDKKLNKLSARLNALANPFLPEAAVETVAVAEEAPVEKKRRGRPAKVKAESAPAL